MEDNIKFAGEVTTRRLVTEILEKSIEDQFTVGYDEQEAGIMTPMRNMVERALIGKVEQCCQDTILVRNMDRLAQSIRFMDAQTPCVIENTSFIAPFTAFVKNHVDRIVEARFESN